MASSSIARVLACALPCALAACSNGPVTKPVAGDSRLSGPAVAPDAVYVEGSAAKVCQLTGERDREHDQFTTNRTRSRFGVWGTDLGYPVEHAGKLYLLFGDTQGWQGAALAPEWESEGQNPVAFLDSLAVSTDVDPEDCVAMDFIADPGAPAAIYMPPQIDPASYPEGLRPIGHGGGRVPVSGFSAHGDLYVFFSKRAGDIQRSVLARISGADLEAGNLGKFRFLFDVSLLHPSNPVSFPAGRFIKVSPVIVDGADLAELGLPAGEKALLLFGSSVYRDSDPYLAFVPLADVENHAAWRYLAGVDGAGAPIWATEQSSATPLFDATPDPAAEGSCIGELSVTWNEYLEKWLMLYNCLPRPRGIRFQVADKPWGPWSTQMQTLFHPRRDGGYCHFMHDINLETCPDGDTAFDPYPLLAPWDPSGGARLDEYGGEYAPYVLNRYTKGEVGKWTTVYFAMSTWNPYQVVLMRSTLRAEQPPVADAGPDQSTSADSSCLATATLDASASSDPDGDAITYAWTGPFGPIASTSPVVSVSLPGLGAFPFTVTVTDSFGRQSSDEVVVTVVDRTPPRLTFTLSPSSLWPPNHKLVAVSASVVVQDNCDPAPAVRLVGITSSEPDNGLGDGDTANDIQGAAFGTDDRAFQLRAERSGKGNGRAYPVTYEAVDASTNRTTETQSVRVPHEAR
jgi:hypothetical protein